MAVSSNGTVEAFWTENADSTKLPSLQVVATSTDGGQTFAAPVTIAQVTDYPLTGTPFDVVDLFNRVPGMSARVDCYPHPAADPGSTRVYVVWCDFGSGQGVVKGAVSLDGTHWTQLGTIASVSGRNAFFPEASIAPNGIVNLTFDALTQPPANRGAGLRQLLRRVSSRWTGLWCAGPGQHGLFKSRRLRLQQPARAIQRRLHLHRA